MKETNTKTTRKTVSPAAALAFATRNVKKGDERKSRVSAHDIVFAFLTEGIDAVKQLHATKGCSSLALEKATDLLSEKGRDVRPLSELKASLYPNEGTGQRGRPSVAVGSRREYSVQQVGDGDLFIRLPLGTLPGVKKGARVNVAFLDGEIIVSLG